MNTVELLLLLVIVYLLGAVNAAISFTVRLCADLVQIDRNMLKDSDVTDKLVPWLGENKARGTVYLLICVLLWPMGLIELSFEKKNEKKGS